MRFTVQYPIAQGSYDPAFLDPEVMTRFAQTAERAGFSAIAFTEHPAPSQKWVDGGGHDALDPFAALGFCAAVTKRLLLMTHLLVLPYRNPLLAAKGAATVDVLSGGRLVLGAGSGYLRSEFAALGVDFAERGELFTEAIEAMRGIWSTEGFRFTGRHFTALGQTALPRPVPRPQPDRHPPIWIGGNSVTARRRVASSAQGWTPLINDRTAAATTRTALIDSPARLAEAVSQLRELTEQAGRDPAAITVQVESPDSRAWADQPDLDQHRQHLGQLAAAGADWFVVDPPATDVEAGLDALLRYGEEIARE
ncbi:MAG TPA: LLM class F420-dependent oxidoreductase [Pseudonocardia sp.]|jgi:probable F420-dependent oxidoreductase